jgi:NADH:ubiquinone oxidoreductase subunit 3 (subunit A)
MKFWYGIEFLETPGNSFSKIFLVAILFCSFDVEVLLYIIGQLILKELGMKVW